jgi:hypothetical protein
VNKIPKLESGNLTAEVFDTGIEVRTGGDSWLTEKQARELCQWLGEALDNPLRPPEVGFKALESAFTAEPNTSITNDALLRIGHGFPLYD